MNEGIFAKHCVVLLQRFCSDSLLERVSEELVDDLTANSERFICSVDNALGIALFLIHVVEVVVDQ